MLCWIAAALLAIAGSGVAAPADTAAPISRFNVHDLGRNDLGRVDGDVFISRNAAAADLDALAKAIGSRSSYIWSSTFPYDRAIDQMKSQLPHKVSVNGLSTQINKLVRLFGDDHAQVVNWTDRIPQETVSFEIGKVGTRYFLYTLAPAGLINPEFPYVRSMDGVLIDEWMRVAGDIGQGPYSSDAARFTCARILLRYVNYLREEMRLPVKPEITLEMVSEDGARSTIVRVPVARAAKSKALRSFDLPTESRMLGGNVGYLRVPAHRGDLADKFLLSIDSVMRKFRDTDALIIDARQSGGGERKVLNALFPYFMEAGADPYIFNVVKLRVLESDTEFDPQRVFDGASKRFFYASSEANPKDEAAAYRTFLRTFRPAWSPPADKFTDWYFTSLRPDPQKFHYAKPVYVLIDWGIGSAGDIFISAFKGWPNVTLLGTPTMGRSGQGVVFPLPSSKLKVNLSTMASFQKTGERYDTVGIAPDILMEPVLTDWFNASDSVLVRVQALIAASKAKWVGTR